MRLQAGALERSEQSPRRGARLFLVRGLRNEDVLERDHVRLHAEHLGDVRDPAGAVDQARDLDQEIEGACDLLADRAMGQLDARRHDERFESRERVAWGVRVDRRQRALMARVHRLEHVERLGASDLADDDAVGAHSQRVTHELADADLTLAFDVRRPRLGRDHVLLLELELRRVLDRHDPLDVRDVGGHRIQGRRLTGAGKTTTLNAMSAYIPNVERIVTIEDAAELQLQQQHVITPESRPPNIEGQGEVRIRELVRNSLRMRPDRIIVGEVRGPETLDMLQAMNTGHEGSLTTIHANSPRDALSRLETLVMTAGIELPHRAIREQIASAFDLLVQITRLVDGSRRITHISEVLGMESDVVTLQDVFVAKPPDEEQASSAAGRLLGALECTGLKPHFLEKMATNGVVLPPQFFNEELAGYVGNSNASYGSFQ